MLSEVCYRGESEQHVSKRLFALRHFAAHSPQNLQTDVVAHCADGCWDGGEGVGVYLERCHDRVLPSPYLLTPIHDHVFVYYGVT
jgi:hypothetical protein